MDDIIKIIFLDQEPLTSRRKKAFEIDYLLSQNFDVEFWDLSKYCFGSVDIVGVLHEKYVVKIDSFEEFVKMYYSLNGMNFMFVIEGYLANIKPNINNFLVKNGACTIKYELNTTASLDKSISIFSKIKILNRKHRLLLPLIAAKFLYNIIKNKFNKSYTCVISTGNIFPCDIHINHSDYVLYLESLNNPRLIMEKYVLFLDQYYPFHPDLQSHGIDISKNAEHFFKDLNRFFDLIESKYNVSVVIAAHPKAKYDEGFFNGRQVIYGKSNDLVKDSEGVITIDSASISFVIAYNKPLLLITSNDRIHTSQLEENNNYQKRLSKVIGVSMVNISGIQKDAINISHFSIEHRNNYIYKYLTSLGIEKMLNTSLLSDIYKRIYLNFN